MGSEVAIVHQPAVPAFGFNEVEKIATAIARGGLFGSKDPYAVLTLCMLAQAEGQHPAVVFRDYDLIQGKPAKKAEAMLRDFIHSGGKVVWNRLDDECADATFSHPQGGTVTINWTMARAAKAQLGGKDMWKKYPRQMLRSRTISEGVRTIYPGATSGLYVPEEVRDFDGAAPSDTPATPQPQRARDLKPEPAKAIEARPDAKRAKAEDWLQWLKEEVTSVGGEVEPVRAIFAKAQPTLAKMQTEYPDIYAEAMQFASATDEQPAKPTGASMADQIADRPGETDSFGLEPVAPVAEKSVAEQAVEKVIAMALAAPTSEALEKIIAEAEPHKAGMGPELATKLEIVFDEERRRLEAKVDA